MAVAVPVAVVCVLAVAGPVVVASAVAAAVVLVVVVFAAAVVVAAESAALVAAAVSAAPNPLGPRSALPRGPRSWLRDLHLSWSPVRRSRPSPRFRLQIPEPRCLLLDSSSADSATGCRQAEVAMESYAEPGQWVRPMESPKALR